MRWNALLGLGLLAVVGAVAFLVVFVTRPLVVRISYRNTWIAEVARRGRAARSRLGGRIAIDVVVLVAGAAVVLGLGALFVEILDAVVDADDLTVIDGPVVSWLAAQRAAFLTTFAIGITDLGSAWVLVPGVAVVAAVAARRRRSWYPILVALIALGGNQLLVAVIKSAIGRQRPNPTGQLVTAAGASFPSGHSAGSLVGLAVLAWLVGLLVANRMVRATVWLTAAVITVNVGISRVYLGVHYPSDVLGGWALGLAWLAVVALAAWAWPVPSPPVDRAGNGQSE